VVHRDMKADNVLMTRSDLEATLVIADLGCALRMSSSFEEGRPWVIEVHSVLVSGNESHRAPEVLNALAADGGGPLKAVDYGSQAEWECGCVGWWMLAGAHPFEDYPAGFGIPPDLVVGAPSVSLPSSYSEVLKSSLRRLLSHDPRGRSDLSEFEAALAAVEAARKSSCCQLM
jgi:serine/threonine protein kinase